MGVADIIAIVVIIALLVCAVRYWFVSRKNGCGGCMGCGGYGGCSQGGGCAGCNERKGCEKEKSPGKGDK